MHRQHNERCIFRKTFYFLKLFFSLFVQQQHSWGERTWNVWLCSFWNIECVNRQWKCNNSAQIYFLFYNDRQKCNRFTFHHVLLVFLVFFFNLTKNSILWIFFKLIFCAMFLWVPRTALAFLLPTSKIPTSNY